MAKQSRVVVGISVPPELRKRMLEEGKGINWSVICRAAIERALEREWAEPLAIVENRALKERLRKIRELAEG